MTRLWLIAFGLTVALTAATLPFGVQGDRGSPTPFVLIVHAMTLAHFFIGDLFHWSRFGHRSSGARAWMLLWGAGGVLLFAAVGPLEVFPHLLMVYFIAHYWKEFDLAGAQERGVGAGFIRQSSKLWSGAVVLVGFAVLASGLVEDPRVLEVARQSAWVLAGVLLLMGLTDRLAARARQPSEGAARRRYWAVAAGFLLAFAWIDAAHPLNIPLRYFFLLSHFIFWYLFYWTVVRRATVPGMAASRGWLQRLKRSPGDMVRFMVGVNVLFLVGAGVYGWAARHQWGIVSWMGFVYDPEFRGFLGAWTVLHITWNWPTKQVKGVRVGF